MHFSSIQCLREELFGRLMHRFRPWLLQEQKGKSQRRLAASDWLDVGYVIILCLCLLQEQKGKSQRQLAASNWPVVAYVVIFFFFLLQEHKGKLQNRHLGEGRFG